MIRWEGLDAVTVERAIKMLVRRLHPTAQGIDGAGGDGGRDITWDSSDGLVIFEVKSFTGRLGPSRKRNIRESLTTASGHAPARWVLILPLDPTPAEVAWFSDLRQSFAPIVLEWRGRDWLDGQFAAHPDLRRYVEGSDYDLLERARELNFEQAALANGSTDLAARTDKLVHGRARELSPYWQVDVQTRDGKTVLRYSARVPNAALLDPVVITPTLAFPLDDPEAAVAARALEHALHYGSAVTVPGRFVKGVEVQAAEQTRQLFHTGRITKSGQLEIGEAVDNKGLPLLMTLTVAAQDGTPAATIDISVTRRTVGGLGIRLIGSDVSQVMTVTQVVSNPEADGTRKGTFHFAFQEVIGRYPYQARRVADFILALTPGSQVSAHLGPVRIGYAEVEADSLAEARPVARLVVVLDELQQHFGDLFPVPDGLRLRDLLELEVARRLLAGDV